MRQWWWGVTCGISPHPPNTNLPFSPADAAVGRDSNLREIQIYVSIYMSLIFDSTFGSTLHPLVPIPLLPFLLLLLKEEGQK